MAKKKKGIDAVTSDPKRLRKWLRNPGLRSKLPDQYLSKQQKQNRWLNDPVTPGSSMTSRQLRTTSRAAADLRYGGSIRDAQDAIGVSQKNEKQVASWYEDYQRQLQQHQNNVQANGQAANAQMNATIQGVRGLDQQDAQGVQQANKQLANVTGAPQLQDQTSDPASVARQGLVAGYGAMLAAQAKNANDYASLLTHVVAPGRKVQAASSMRDKTTAAQKNLAGIKDDSRNYRTNYEQQTVQGEAKNILAAAIAQGRDATQRLAIQQRDAANRRSTQAQIDMNNADNATSAANNARTNQNRGRGGSGGGRGGSGKQKPMPASSAAQRKQFTNGYTWARKTIAANAALRSSDRLYRYMNQRNPDGTSPFILRAIAEAAVDGYIHSKTAAAIRKNLGIRVRDFGYPVR